MLGSFFTYPRYCDIRETVFTMLCHKNMGCSHFIIGRDHTGIGEYYSNSDFNKLFSKLGDFDIIQIILDEYGYSEQKKNYIKISDADGQGIKSISGTNARQMLKDGKRPPDWYMREEISNYVIGIIKSGKKAFI